MSTSFSRVNDSSILGWTRVVITSLTIILTSNLILYWFDTLAQGQTSFGFKLIYGLGLGYTWLTFTVSFGLGAISHHLSFYNIPTFLLFLAGAILYGIAWRKRS